jgi:ATP-dependent helicase/nuclease subunit A
MIKIISAGAGSGKTYRLMSEMVDLLKSGTRASGIVATTFTTKAAAELQERVRTKLLEEGLTAQANALSNALIGTVHSLGVKLLKRFAFEAGVSPQVDILADEDRDLFFNRSLAQILVQDRVENLNELCERLGLTKKTGAFDWRREIRQIVDVARANAFSEKVLEESKVRSFETFCEILGNSEHNDDLLVFNAQAFDYNTLLLEKLAATIQELENQTVDETQKTRDAITEYKSLSNELRRKGQLSWHQWIKIKKIEVGAKSRDFVQELQDFTNIHLQLPSFQRDIRDYIFAIFDISKEAIAEYTQFKKQRGLIDYTDMEVLVVKLLDNPAVVDVLREELDLLMVDEFQDTSPIQLDFFLKLSKIAKVSIWVGDPKQSIYGFRGAEPRLMKAIVDDIGIKKQDILGDSWRSRPDIVFASNAIFTKAFAHLPADQVSLNPQRTDNNLQTQALVHWQFQLDNGGDKRIRADQRWADNCLAEAIRLMLERKIQIQAKGQKGVRTAQAGDVAILCRSNNACLEMAAALSRVGIKAAIAQQGLLETAEAKLVLAVLRYTLNKHDSLSVAEILLLGQRENLADIVRNRLDFLEVTGDENYNWRWAHDNALILKINELRKDTLELSAAEVLNLVLEEFDLRRIVATWGNTAQRFENIDMLRKYALQYEQACNRLHMAASLGGFLLWLSALADRAKDNQSSGVNSDAVNVLTYHRSKGLEYPIVVLGSLDSASRGDVFGISIEANAVSAAENAETPDVDLNNILSGRWLRFWVNPYADQIKGTELAERLERSSAQKRAERLAFEEECRLLYVGITRARDYLVFPTAHKPTRWLNRTWHGMGGDDKPVLEQGMETPFLWADRWLEKDFEETHFPKNFAHVSESDSEPLFFLEPRVGKAVFTSYKIEFFKEGKDTREIFSLPETSLRLEEKTYAPALVFSADAPAHDVSEVFKTLLAAFQFQEKNSESPAFDAVNWNFMNAKTLSETFGLTEMLNFQDLARQAVAFFDFWDSAEKVEAVVKNYAVKHIIKTRFLV